MKSSLKKILQIPVVCVVFVVAGLLSALLLVWMAVVSVGLLVRKGVHAAFDRLKGRKESKGPG